MKKLIIAAAIVCAAAFAQAAALNWGSVGVQITGDFETGEGSFAVGFTAFLINAEAYDQAAVWAGMKSATDVNAYLSGVSVGGGVKTGADGDFKGSFDIGGATAYNAFLVILDGDQRYAFVSDTYAAEINTVQAVIRYDGEGYVNALDYTTAGQAGSNWQAIPEPTSGLLLLLGVAGLALKRKRA